MDERDHEIDLERPESTAVGVTHGETDLELGGPGEVPDYTNVAVTRDEGRVLVTVDAEAGDHATGHADVELTPDEASRLSELLDGR